MSNGLTIEKRQQAMRYLVEACDILAASHRRRRADFSFTTLSEEAAIRNLKLRLKEWDKTFSDAEQSA